MKQNRREFLTGMAVVSGGLSLSVPTFGDSGPTTWHASQTNFPEIVYNPKSALPVRYASEQLDLYLRKILGNQAQVIEGRGPRIILEQVSRTDLGDEGFELLCQGRDLFVRGTPAGIAYGAFEFLRQYTGCRFSGYAPDGEEVPKRDSLQLTAFHTVRKPQLWYRGYDTTGWREPLEMVTNQLDWMVKNGLNYLVYWPLPDNVTDPIGGLVSPSIGDAAERTRLRYHEYWFEQYVLPEVQRRGLKIDFNAHNLGYWLPPERYYDQHPEWYALINGERSRLVDHKQLCICTSHQDAVDTLVRNVLDFLPKHPEVSLVGITQEDGLGMCQCEPCVSGDPNPKDAFRPYVVSLTGGRQNASKCVRYAKLVNAVAKAVGKEFPDRLVSYTAYSDVLWPPEGVTLEPNVAIRFSTTDRDDAHPLSDDTPSATNRLLFGVLRQWKQVHPGKIYLVEALMGRHLLKSFPYPMAESICKQWPSLKRLGIEGGQSLCWCSHHETYATQNLAFARSGWEDEVKIQDIMEDYLTGAFGTSAPQVRPLFEGLQEAMRDIARGKPEYSMFLSRITPGEMTPDPATVGYFLEAVGEPALRQAASPVTGGREERQIRTLGAVIEYWRRGAEIMRMELLAERAVKEGRQADADALYQKAVAAGNAIVLYIDAQPTRGWICVTAPAAWVENSMKWRAALAGHEYNLLN